MSALANAAAVLRCFSADRLELSVTEVAARLSMPKSTASRLLKAMREQGLLEPIDGSKRYRPGALLFTLGRLYRAASTLTDRLDEMLRRVVERTGHTGFISVRTGLEVMGVRLRTGREDVAVVQPVGSRLPVVASATGRALLARLTDAEVERLLPAEWEPYGTAPRGMPELLQRLAQVRRDGLSVAEGEARPRIGSIAVAVMDPETGEAASACIAYPLATVGAAGKQLIKAALLEGAASVGAALGDPAWETRQAHWGSFADAS